MKKRKIKKDHLDLVADEINEYNKKHGTCYSYGYYTMYKRMGLLGTEPTCGLSVRSEGVRRRARRKGKH